jgi:hypothetical protein
MQLVVEMFLVRRIPLVPFQRPLIFIVRIIEVLLIFNIGDL